MNKAWNASGTYNLFDIGLTTHKYASNQMWPWPTIDILSADPFKNASGGDYRLDDESVGAGECRALAWPQFPYRDGVTQTHNFARDIGPYQTPIESDFPDEKDVRDGVAYNKGVYLGRMTVPTPTNVRNGITYDAPVSVQTGTCHVPGPSHVRDGVPIDHTIGVLDIPIPRDVREGVDYDNETHTGELVVPATTNVRHGTVYDAPVAPKTGTCRVPVPADVRINVLVDHTYGTLNPSRQVVFEDLSHVVED